MRDERPLSPSFANRYDSMRSHAGSGRSFLVVLAGGHRQEGRGRKDRSSVCPIIIEGFMIKIIDM